MRIIQLHFREDNSPILLDAEKILAVYASRDPYNPGVIVDMGNNNYCIVSETMYEVEESWKYESRI